MVRGGGGWFGEGLKMVFGEGGVDGRGGAG